MPYPRHHINPPQNISQDEIAELQLKDDLILVLSLAERCITDLLSCVLFRYGTAKKIGEELLSRMTASKKIDLLKTTMKELGRKDSETDKVIRKLRFLSEVRNRMWHGDKAVDLNNDEFEVQQVFGTKPTKKYKKEELLSIFWNGLFDIIDDIKYSLSDELVKIRDQKNYNF